LADLLPINLFVNSLPYSVVAKKKKTTRIICNKMEDIEENEKNSVKIALNEEEENEDEADDFLDSDFFATMGDNERRMCTPKVNTFLFFV
jgi:hypothetical protein